MASGSPEAYRNYWLKLNYVKQRLKQRRSAAVSFFSWIHCRCCCCYYKVSLRAAITNHCTPAAMLTKRDKVRGSLLSRWVSDVGQLSISFCKANLFCIERWLILYNLLRLEGRENLCGCCLNIISKIRDETKLLGSICVHIKVWKQH